MTPDLARARDLSEALRAKGVRYGFAAYVDVHGVPKGKAVPIEKLEKMCRGTRRAARSAVLDRAEPP